MGLKIFMLVFILTSIALSLLYIPTQLTASFSQIRSFNILATNSVATAKQYPVSFAYLISASKGDVSKLKRLLQALYHPGNYYLIHLDYGADLKEHQEIAKFVSAEPLFKKLGNVWIVQKPNLVTYRGPTMLATTLHGIAMLLRTCQWDWFINLSASDYPLITQDGMYDLIDAFSGLPKNLNFVQHSSHLGWKLNKRGKPIIIDPGLYSLKKSEIWWAIKQRSLPTAFKLFTGSAWTVLSRSFAEYTIVGWDNLPRILLLYYANFVSSPEGYFQTLICNSKDYKNTTVNHDLHHIAWDNPPKQHPRSLGLKDYGALVQSNRPFARKFNQDDRVLDKIDRELLKRHQGHFSHGGWCLASGKTNGTCVNFQSQNYGVLRPGSGSKRLRTLLTGQLSTKKINPRQCT